MTKTICPHCMDEREVSVVNWEDTVQVREDAIKVTTQVIVCQTCFKEFNNSEVPNLAHEEAYKIYRRTHNLLTPEELKYHRHAFNYSYLDLSKKSGVNPEQIEMIERGGLHDKKTDLDLRKAFGI